MKRTAHISKCGLYRYNLKRIWDKDKPRICFIMLNPSKADGLQDDPTIIRVINYSKAWGFGSVVVVNLFAYRSTEPENLLKNIEIAAGPDNMRFIKRAVNQSSMVIMGWGNYKILKKFNSSLSDGSFIYELLRTQKDKLHYIEMSVNNTPKHPLFLKGNLTTITHEKPNH